MVYMVFFFFNDTATTEIYTLSLHDALPIYPTKAALFHGHNLCVAGNTSAKLYGDAEALIECQIGRAHV